MDSVWVSASIAMDKSATSGKFGSIVTGDGSSTMAERNIERVLRLFAVLTALILAMVVGFIAKQALLPVPSVASIESSSEFRIIPWLIDWLLVSAFAILMAFPMGLLTALYVSEIAPEPVSQVLVRLFGVLQAIPSIVVAWVGAVFATVRWGNDMAQLPTMGLIAVLLAMATYPNLVHILLERFALVPPSFKAASYALGASRWQTIRQTILPMVRPGAIAAALMGFRRVLGETAIVLVITHGIALGTLAVETCKTIPVAIATGAEVATPGTIQYQGVFFLGLIVLVVAYLLNHLAQCLMRLQGGEWE